MSSVIHYINEQRLLLYLLSLFTFVIYLLRSYSCSFLGGIRAFIAHISRAIFLIISKWGMMILSKAQVFPWYHSIGDITEMPNNSSKQLGLFCNLSNKLTLLFYNSMGKTNKKTYDQVFKWNLIVAEVMPWVQYECWKTMAVLLLRRAVSKMKPMSSTG